MKLLLIRHGQTEKNVAGHMHRVNDDSPLNQTGQQQAAQTAQLCKTYRVSTIYSSPEARAIQTADIIGQTLGVQNHVLDGLKERNWGEWSHQPWEQLKTKLDTMTTDERYTFVPHQGESWKQMDHRLKAAIDTITTKADQAVAIVTHAGALRALIPLLKGDAKETSFQYDPENASVTVFEYNDGKFKLELLLDTSHLG